VLRSFAHAASDADAIEKKQSLARRLESRFDVPAYCINDIRAACVAELAIGSGYETDNTLYVNLDFSLGAGIILEGRLIGPETQLSSSLHSLPIPGREGKCVGDYASITALRDSIERSGLDFSDQRDADFSETREIFARWCGDAVNALAVAIRAASATLSVDRVLIASCLRDKALSGLVRELRYTLETNSDSRIRLPEMSMETVSPHPRARGTAMVPFLKIFGMPDIAVSARAARQHVA